MVKRIHLVGHLGAEALHERYRAAADRVGHLFAAVRSVVDTGRQNGLSVFQSIRATLDGNAIFMTA